jgi:hypothetical protein
MIINWLFDNPPLCIVVGYYPINVNNLTNTDFFIIIDNLIEIPIFLEIITYPMVMKKINNWPTLIFI